MFPDLPFPPQPVVTRWGTWIEAAIYYAENFDRIKSFLDEFDSSEAQSIRKAKTVIAQTSLKRELTFIKSNFSCIPTNITKLQAKNVALVDAVETFGMVRTSLERIRGNTGFLKKLDRVVARNKNSNKIKAISDVLSTGKSTQSDPFVDTLSPDEISAFKFAPITSCDVERTFSMYKNVLSDNRRSFLFENLRKYVVIVCNQLDT